MKYYTTIYLTRGITLQIFDHYPTKKDILSIGFDEQEIVAYKVE